MLHVFSFTLLVFAGGKTRSSALTQYWPIVQKEKDLTVWPDFIELPVNSTFLEGLYICDSRPPKTE